MVAGYRPDYQGGVSPALRDERPRPGVGEKQRPSPRAMTNMKLSTGSRPIPDPCPRRYNNLRTAIRNMRAMERDIFRTDGEIPAFLPGTGTPNPQYIRARYEIEFYLVPGVKK